MYSKAGRLTRLSRLWEKAREGKVRCVTLALRFINYCCGACAVGCALA
jgi:hypothetical protein